MAILLKSSKPSPKIKISPLVYLREGVIFPQAEAILTFGRTASIEAIKAAAAKKTDICFVSQKDPKISEPKVKDLYKVGTLCRILRVLPVNNELHAIVHGLDRVRIHNIQKENSSLLAAVTKIPDVYKASQEVDALVSLIVSNAKKALSLGKANVDIGILAGEPNAIVLSHQISSILSIDNEKKQQLLEEPKLLKRLRSISEYLSKEINTLNLEHKIAKTARKKFDKDMKEAILRERMKTIQKELGEGEAQELDDLKKKVKALKVSDEIKKKVEDELKRLSRMSSHNPESGYVRSWIETIVDLPWGKESKSRLSLIHADKVLSHDHFGLEKVKQRVLEYIAVIKLKTRNKKRAVASKAAGKLSPQEEAHPTILCFVGPPGVGKTSVGRSIATALGREFVRISLGGIRDEAEIRGHRRTYVGALPGRIIQAIREAKTKNPVFMLDEIDKIGADYKGDPSAALLEVLDPEQNSDFRDHYLDVPFDLSKVIFITTANILDTIPSALRDRLEIIKFSGYTEDEKYVIAKQHLLPKQIKANGLHESEVKISSAALHCLVRYYTREAGVRSLERQIASLLRKVAHKLAKSRKIKTPIGISPAQVTKMLGPRIFSHTLIEGSNQTGISTGLAYTQAGGDIMFIEVALMSGKGKIILTGQLGSVMKESARAALSYVRSHAAEYGLDAKALVNTDVHIHVPEGAVPKDGPSAGLAITTALLSALLKKPVSRELAMTGEVTLRGRALEIGGVKEKVIAAHRAGIKTIILPKDNKKNLIDIPDKVKRDLKFHYVTGMDEVSSLVFGKLK